MTSTNAYETLYYNMKNKFTVVNENCEYTLGEYMSMKANAKSAEASNLPAVRNANQNHSIAAIFSYVNDKLAVKKPPVRDKVMRRFPFRTSAAAFLSAIVACALMLSYGIFALNSSYTVPTAETEQSVIEELEEEIDKSPES